MSSYLENQSDNEIKTWICRQGINFLLPIHLFILMHFGPNHLANILGPELLAHSKQSETSKLKSFTRMVMRKNSIPIVNL